MRRIAKRNEFRILIITSGLIFNLVLAGRAQENKKIERHLVKDILYSPGDTLKADFYLPVKYKQQLNPVLVFVTGFGSDFRKWEHYIDWANFAASNGFIGIVYSATEGGVNRNFTDLINFIYSANKKYYMDTNRISIYAASGNASAGLPLANNDARVKAALIYYGTAKMENYRLDLPVLLVRAGLDNIQLNKQIDSLAFLAMVNNAPYTIANFNTAPHAFESFTDKDVSFQFQKMTLEFLKYNLRHEVQRDLSLNAQKVLAMREMYAANWQSAFEAYSLVVQNNPGDNEAERQLGNICIELKEYKKAIGYYNNAIIHGNWRKGEIGLKKLYAYAKLDSIEAAVTEMRLLKKIGWFEEKEYVGKDEFDRILQSASYISFVNEK